MILADSYIHQWGTRLVSPFEPDLVNPASLDIRVGRTAIGKRGVTYDLTRTPLMVAPGDFLLVETYETIMLPLDLVLPKVATNFNIFGISKSNYDDPIYLAADMLLKSSRAREGWDHSLAFWFDPGWSGIGTMEIRNVGHEVLELSYKQRFGQLRFHVLLGKVLNPYAGRYNYATTVETAKPEPLKETKELSEATIRV